MPILEIVAAAADEAEAAADWYEHEQPGLGRQFRESLNAGLELLEDGLVSGSPMPGHLGRKGVRRLVLRRFPYDIVFLGSSRRIIVLGFAHHARCPAYWRSRMNR
ncbi:MULTISPECIES: type II toxin-antitoxin system RelE/ParE family toxin [unclassified Thioalkalivibrio]|uniref:type II toxin-antitoxin system RelE/ParE family toxin n=1 Tax=unclassified Thioalkalivibrio TaxID=2621013 RepID=UPI0003696A2C|nr:MULTISPECIES: type II toxin-antitoxin system RelE/ParE family toxin [unclassified Thioalkalivibrio]